MKKREVVTIKMDSVSENEEFARVAVAVFLSRMDPTLEEIEDVKTAVSEAVTNAVIHGYQGGEGTITLEVSVEVVSAPGSGTTVTMRKKIGR